MTAVRLSVTRGAVQAIAIAALLSCAPPPAPVTTVSRPTWPAGSYPVTLRLSAALSDSQIAAVLAGVAWVEARAGMDVFEPVVVASDDAAVLGIPQHRVVAVLPATALTRPTTLGEATPWRRGDALSYVEVALATDSPRVALHELLHACGLPHSSNPRALMYPTHGSVDAWELSDWELALIRRGGTEPLPPQRCEGI